MNHDRRRLPSALIGNLFPVLRTGPSAPSIEHECRDARPVRLLRQPGFTSHVWLRTAAAIMEPGRAERTSRGGPIRPPPPGGDHDEPLLGQMHTPHASRSGSRVSRFLTASPGSPLIIRPLHLLYYP